MRLNLLEMIKDCLKKRRKRKYLKEYYQKNKARLKIYHKKWSKLNREYLNAYQRSWKRRKKNEN